MGQPRSTSLKPVLGGRDAVRVCIAQVSPAYLDRSACIDRAEQAIAQAAANGADLIVFPEVWLAGYPYWTEGWDSRLEQWAEGRQWFFDAALMVPSEDSDRLGAAFAQAGVYGVMGCNEIDPRPGVNTIYNTLLYFDRDGTLMGRHRKLLPTFTEKLFWGSGDASDLVVYDTDIGRLGGLICGENLVTPLRAAMIGMGEDLHVAVFPGSFSLHEGPQLEEWDNSGNFWGHINTRNHSLEAGCFTIAVSAVLNPDDVPEDFPYREKMNIGYSLGGSQVVSPLGMPLVGPVEGEELIYADCPAAMIKAFKAICDTAGHYSRPDAARIMIKTDQGWRPATPDYASGPEPARSLREAADRHEVDEDAVQALADKAGIRTL
jgi:predicted amidohydrolase